MAASMSVMWMPAMAGTRGKTAGGHHSPAGAAAADRLWSNQGQRRGVAPKSVGRQYEAQASGAPGTAPVRARAEQDLRSGPGRARIEASRRSPRAPIRSLPGSHLPESELFRMEFLSAAWWSALLAIIL